MFFKNIEYRFFDDRIEIWEVWEKFFKRARRIDTVFYCLIDRVVVEKSLLKRFLKNKRFDEGNVWIYIKLQSPKGYRFKVVYTMVSLSVDEPEKVRDLILNLKRKDKEKDYLYR